MKHRHLVYPRGTPPERLPSAAIVDILDRGDLDDWRPIAAAVRRRPFGALAERVLRLIDEFPMYGTSRLWRVWIERCRIRAEAVGEGRPPLSLADLRRLRGRTQAEVAARAGMRQSDLSKLERRGDVRLSTLRAYARALGGRVATDFVADGARVPLRLGPPARRAAQGPRRRAGG